MSDARDDFAELKARTGLTDNICDGIYTIEHQQSFIRCISITGCSIQGSEVRSICPNRLIGDPPLREI